MSYATSSFVQAQPAQVIVKPVETAKAQTKRVQASVRKEATTKILLFVAIVACLVLAVNI